MVMATLRLYSLSVGYLGLADAVWPVQVLPWRVAPGPLAVLGLHLLGARGKVCTGMHRPGKSASGLTHFQNNDCEGCKYGAVRCGGVRCGRQVKRTSYRGRRAVVAQHPPWLRWRGAGGRSLRREDAPVLAVTEAGASLHVADACTQDWRRQDRQHGTTQTRHSLCLRCVAMAMAATAATAAAAWAGEGTPAVLTATAGGRPTFFCPVQITTFGFYVGLEQRAYARWAQAWPTQRMNQVQHAV